MPSLSSGAAPSFAELGPAIPRATDAIASFAGSAQAGSAEAGAAQAGAAQAGAVGTVNGERARLNRAYNAASGRECREIILGSGQAERTAVACREADGSFVSSRPLLRGALR